MEALLDIPGFFLALALVLLLNCILSAREAPTGPQVRTSVRDKSFRDKSVRDKHSQVFQVPKNDNRFDGTAFTFFFNICGGVGVVQGQGEHGGRHKTTPVTCGERRKRLVVWCGRDGKWHMPLCQYRRRACK
ncbi:hypothetical protein C8J57DRAFT_1231162 [Mycena rebaudengoi]|jgi:hypothetical protein|nr:hypothetical protein C8J57DRAFT_1231162 [Mycena rebaudengoi]